MIKKIPMRKRFVTHCYQFLFCFNQRPVPTNPDTFETTFLTLTRIRVHLRCVQTNATLLTNNSQHCWMLHVASVCTPCCMLLDVVAQSLKPVKLLAPCKRTQHCWLTTPNIVGSCCARLHVALLWKAVSKRCSVSDWLISYGGKTDSCRNICSFKNIRMRVDAAQVYDILQVWTIFKTQLDSLV